MHQKLNKCKCGGEWTYYMQGHWLPFMIEIGISCNNCGFRIRRIIPNTVGKRRNARHIKLENAWNRRNADDHK